MWWRSAVNRTLLSLAAASRIRSSALCASFRPCVRVAFCWRRFPSTSPLPSISSAAGCPALFGDFSATTELCDFLCPFIAGVGPWTSRRGLRLHQPQADTGSLGSRARCFRTCLGSLTAREPCASRDSDASGVAFRLVPRRRPPEGRLFRGSIPSLYLPLSTLRLLLTEFTA